MGYITDKGADVYRDNVVVGVPASGKNEPYKPEIRGLFASIDGALATLLAAFVADQAVVVYAARSSLYANLTPADRTLGLVYNDGANNGVYIKSGAAGSGSWTLTGLMLRGETGDDGPAGKSFLQTAIDSGYVPTGTTEAQLTDKIVGQITAVATGARDAAVVARVGAETAQAGARAAEQSSQTNAATADTAKNAVLQAIGQVPSTSVLQIPVATRSSLRALTNLVAGLQASLTEAGREGTWEWRVGDYSSQIAADPDEALYLKATGVAANQGAWCRVVTGMIYRAEWAGITDGFVDTVQGMPTNVGNGTIDPSYPQSRTFQRLINMLPDGAFLFVPGVTAAVAQLLECTKSIHFVGIEGKTRLTGTGLAQGQGNGIIRLNGSNSSITGIEFFNMRNNFGTIPPAAIVVAGNTDPARQNNPVRNILISRCRFTNVSAGIIAYASDWQKSDAGAQNTENVVIEDCIWDGCDQEHTNLYGVNNWRFRRNQVRMDFLNINRDYYCFRLIGATNGIIEDNVFNGPGYARSDMRCVNILDGAGPLGQGNGITRKCSNILIRNNDCYDFTLGIRTGDSSTKDIFFIENRLINRVAKSDTHRETIAIYGSGYTRSDGSLVCLNNFIRGYDSFYYLEFGVLTQLDIMKNNFAALGRFDQGKPSVGIARCNGLDISLVRINDNDVSGPQIDGPLFGFPNCSANLRAQMLENRLPEIAYPVGDGRRSPANGVGSVQTALNGAFFDMASGQVPAGNNSWAATGTYAASQRVPA